MVASENNRIYSLDVLRGIAILLVLFRHAPDKDASQMLLVIRGIGWTGVDLFFVLSGFLISGLLFKEFDRSGKFNIKRFWLRRGMKIWPSYFVTYGAAMLMTIISTGKLELLKTQAPNYVFIQNYIHPFTRLTHWTHSWSIAIEEHFYLALPVVLVFLAPTRFRRLVTIGVIVCVGVLALRVILFSLLDLSWPHFYYPSHMRVDSLSFGVMLGYLYQYKRATFLRLARFWPLLLGLSPLVLLAYFYPLETSAISFTIGFTIFYLVFGGLVIAARAYPDVGKSGPLRLLALMGVYSYTIYLAHSVIYELPGIRGARLQVILLLGRSGDRILFFVLSILLGVLLSHCIERPFLRLREKWLPGTSVRAKALASPPTTCIPAPAPST